MTPFVIKLAKPFLKYIKPSLIDYGHLCGLIALILVAVSPVFVYSVSCTQQSSWSMWSVHLKKLENLKIQGHSMLTTRPSSLNTLIA